MNQDVGQINPPRSTAQRNKHEGRTLDTPECQRTPRGPQLDLPPPPFPLPAAVPPIGPIQFNDPFQNNYVPASAPAPACHHLPAHLVQAVAQLPPLQPVRRRGRGRSINAIQNNNRAAAPAPAPAPAYQHLPLHLA